MRILTCYLPCQKPASRLTIEVVSNIERAKPDTPEELIPKGMFRCFVCWQIKSSKHFADELYNKRVCKECYPFISEQDVGYMVAFDRRRGFANT